MACKDCGPQQAAPGPCRTFTFPLRDGAIELIVKGDVRSTDLGPLTNYVNFALGVLAAMFGEKKTEKEPANG